MNAPNIRLKNQVLRQSPFLQGLREALHAVHSLCRSAEGNLARQLPGDPALLA